MAKRYGLPLVAGLAVTGAIGLTPAAEAQTAPVATAQAAPASGGLEEVVVTAEKRQENVQEVPIAVEAFNEHQIDALQITDLDAVAQHSPGLSLTRNLAGAQMSIRGVGGFGITPGIESDVALFVDGIYSPSIQSAAFAFNNIASTEVLKGPQGTLFGRNALGGVISIKTKDPTQTPHIDFNIGYGNFNTVTGNFYGTTGITDHLAADLALYGENQADGWGKNRTQALPGIVGPQDWHTSREYSGRSKWLFTPDDATKITFIVDWDRDQPNTVGAGYLRGFQDGNHFNSGPLHVGGPYDVYVPNGYYANNTQYGGSLTIDHDFGWAEGKSMTSWRKNVLKLANPVIDTPPYNINNPAIGQYPNTTVVSSDDWNEQDATQEFNIIAPTSSTIQWVGGIFLYEDEAVMTPRANGPTNAADGGPFVGNQGVVNAQGVVTTPPTPFANNFDNVTYDMARQATQSYAGFGQATAPIMPGTDVTIGYRYTIDVRQISGFTVNQLGTILSTAGTNPSGTRKRYPKSTYRLALHHDFSENVNGYISFNRGFQSGAYNVVAGPTPAAVAPEVMDAYEAGIKSDLLDHTLRVNAAVFYYNLNNYVATQYVNNAPVSINAANTEYKGVDLDITYAATRQLTFGFGIDLLDPTYKSFPGAVFFNLTAPGSMALFSSFPGNATGNQVAYTEKTEGTVSAQYRIPMETGDVFLATDLAYHSGLVFDAQNLLKQPAYTLWNASATWTAPSGSWDVKLWAKNLGNTIYAESYGSNSSNFTDQPAPPRTFGINVGWHWDGAPAEAPYTPPPAPMAAATPAPAAPAPAPEVQRAFQVFFDFDKSDVTDAAAKVIQAAAANVKAGHVTTINVTGHTDTVGSAAYNQGLSERRAAAVKQQLVSDGVSDGEISTVGVGKTGLLVPTADGVREPQNRRAEIVLQ